MEIKMIYGIIALVSMALVFAYCRVIQKKDNWFILLYISVAIVNSGYFIQAVSKSLEGALTANRFSYFGSVFLPLSMLMIIMNVCRIQYKKWMTGCLTAVSIIVFLVAASGGYFPLYYKNVSLTFVNGAAKLVKEYGPLHSIYYLYLLAYLVMMAAIISYAVIRKKIFKFKHAALLLCVVFGNIMIWFVEQRIQVDFEFLSVSYVITELFLLFLYGLLQDFEKMSSEAREQEERRTIEEILLQYTGVLTERELDVLKLILQDRMRREIAEELSVTEHTVKKHTSHIFTKLEVTSRKELYQKVGYRP